MMIKKKIIFVLLALVTGCSFSFSQKVYYVDTQYILKQMPQYQQAKKRIETTVEKWRKEMEVEENKVAQMETTFENEKVLLTKDQIKQKEKEIEERKEKLRELSVKRFGVNGDMIRTRQSLVRPIQDQVWNVINKIAKKKGIGIVLDKSSSLIMIYSNPKYDLSDWVIKELKGKNNK